MTQAANAQEARHEFIDVLRSLNPDKVLSDRLDTIEKSLDRDQSAAASS